MVRQVLNPIMVSAFVDEMTKIAVGVKSLKGALGGGLSTNVMNRSSVKITKPTVRTAPPPPRGRVTTVGGSSIATQTPGVNIRPPTVNSPKMPLQQQIQPSVAPASPSYVSPQVNVQAAPTMQGRPQITQAAPQATGGGASSAKSGGSGGMKTAMSEAEVKAYRAMQDARKARFESMDDNQLLKEHWKMRVKRYGVLPPVAWYNPQARMDAKTIKAIRSQRESAR